MHLGKIMLMQMSINCCIRHCYSAPVRVCSIVINPSRRLSVCLSASISLDRSSGSFVCRSPVAVAWSSSGGIAIHYVLPVLWMTSGLATVGRMHAHTQSREV